MSLVQLCSSSSPPEFTSKLPERVPVAHPRAAASLLALFDWDTLDAILQQPPLLSRSGSDVLVVRRSRLLPSLPPRSLVEARALLRAGSSLFVRNAEQRHPDLQQLAAYFERPEGELVKAQLSVTPQGERGFGWRYESEDVLIVQTAGVEEYFFRQNTVDQSPAQRPGRDFTTIRQEKTPVMACALVAGDWLHIPSGWWHVATARQDSLAMSVRFADGHAALR